MKQTQNALKFLLAQYRAIFKHAYVKGLSTAVLLTAGLAAGQAAQAADLTAGLDNGNNYYFQESGSNWEEVSNSGNGAYSATDGIVAGAIGGNGISGDDLSPEQGLTAVTGGDLVIDGVGGNKGSLAYISSGAAAGAWGLASSGNLRVYDNMITITGSGKVDKAGATDGTRGVVYGGRARAAAGFGEASQNQIIVKQITDGAVTASNGFIGGQAIGFTGALAHGNKVEITVALNTPQQLSLSGSQTVIGGSVQSVASGGSSGTGTYTATQNIVNLSNVSAAAASSQNLLILGAHFNLSKADDASTSLVAQGNQITLNGGAFTFADSTSGSIFGVANDKAAGNQSYQNLNFSQNTVKLTDAAFTIAESVVVAGASANSDGTSTVNNNTVELINAATTPTPSITDSKGLTVAGAIIEGSGSTATATGNTVTITDNENKANEAAKNSIHGGMVAGASINTAYQTDQTLKITATGNKVSIGSNTVLDLADGVGVAGAYIVFSGDKTQSLTATGNSVEISGEVSGDVKAVYLQQTNSFTTGDSAPTLSFLNNSVTLKTGSKVQSGSLVGGAGNNSVITIENGSTYIANNDVTSEWASDRIEVAGNVTVESGKNLQISGYYENGVTNNKFHENLTNIGSTAVIQNAGSIYLYGKAVVANGATLSATADGALITLNGASSDQTDMEDALNQADRVSGAGFATLNISKSQLQSYLSADKVLSNTSNDGIGRLNLTSGGALELADTTNIDLATSFNFNTTAQNGAIQVDVDSTGEKGSIIRGNELTISQKLAKNAVKTSELGSAATTYAGLDALGANGIKIEANTLNLGSNTLTSAQAAEITFADAKVKNEINFMVTSGKDGADGFVLADAMVKGDNYTITNSADSKNQYYTTDVLGNINGAVTISGSAAATKGELSIVNGDWQANDAITLAGSGALSVGGQSTDPGKLSDNNPSLPDATLKLTSALTIEDAASAATTVTVTGNTQSNQPYNYEHAQDTLGDDGLSFLDLTAGHRRHRGQS